MPRPAHANRVTRILGYTPNPVYNISVDGDWVGSYHDLPFPHKGRFFSPRQFKTKSQAIAHAKRLSGKKIEVWESFGSFPEDRMVVWRK